MQHKNNEGQPHAIQDKYKLCGAKTRCGKVCQSFPVNGKQRCRMHGGAMGSGAPKGNKNAFKHGRYGQEWVSLKKTIAVLLK